MTYTAQDVNVALQQPGWYVLNVPSAGTAAAQASRTPSTLGKVLCKCIFLFILACYFVYLFVIVNAMIIQNFKDCGLPACPLELSLFRLYGVTTVNNAEMWIVARPSSTPSSMNNATAAVAPRGLAATHRRPFTLPVDVAPPKGQSHIPARALEVPADQHILHNDTVLSPPTVPDPGLDHRRRQKNLKPRTPADIPYNPPSKGTVVVLPGSGLRTDYVPPRFRKPVFAPANNTTNPTALAPTYNTTLINHPPTAPTNNTHLPPTNTTNTLTYPALPPNTPFRRIFPAAPLPDSCETSQKQTFLLPPLSPDGPPRLVNQAGEAVPIPLAVFMMWRKHRDFGELLFDEVVPES